MIQKKIFFFLIFFYLFMLNISINGKEKSVNDKEYNGSSYWIDAGFGGSYFGPTLIASFSYSYKNNVFSIRYVKGDEFEKFSFGGGDPNDRP